MRQELESTRLALARHAERLQILHEIDRAVVAEKSPMAIDEVVVQLLRDLLGVPRAIVNIFDRGGPRHRAQSGRAARWPNLSGVDARAGERLPYRPPRAALIRAIVNRTLGRRTKVR